MRTIQEIEALDLNKLSRKELGELKNILRESFYLTSIKDILSDGRSAKDVIGNEYSRISTYHHDKYLLPKG